MQASFSPNSHSAERKKSEKEPLMSQRPGFEPLFLSMGALIHKSDTSVTLTEVTKVTTEAGGGGVIPGEKACGPQHMYLGMVSVIQLGLPEYMEDVAMLLK